MCQRSSTRWVIDNWRVWPGSALSESKWISEQNGMAIDDQ